MFMKKNLFTAFLLCCFTAASAQNSDASCCAASATEVYAINAKDKNFISKHDEPLPFHYASANGKDINYATADGKMAHAWEVKAAAATPYYLFVVHEWWGLNDYIKKEAEQLSQELGINVVAVDLYDNVVASTREDAAKTMQSVKTERAMAILKGAYVYAGKEARVFTMGWCFGGGWSLQTTLLGGEQAVGCIMYYGQPEKDVEKLKTLHADVIGFFGNLDQYPSPQMVTEFVENMQKAGKKLLVNRYEAPHAFANPSNPGFNKEATADAHKKAIDFIKERMH
jgi:carboxymethylenebutenolidase